MSGVLGLFAAEGASTGDLIRPEMIAGLKRRGADGTERIGDTRGALALTHFKWEAEVGDAGTLIANYDGIFVAADAALYYRSDLRKRLRDAGVESAADSPAQLIRDAYRAWGRRCAEHLEGDFAFILWDPRGDVVLAARDFSGRRPLFHAELGRTLVVASTVGAILAHPRCPADLNLAEIAATAAGLFAVGDETSYLAIRTLPAGCTLSRHRGRTQIFRHWTAPAVTTSTPWRRESFADAAAELRHLLCGAVEERLDPDRQTSVWMSGGWDSTAVFAAGQHVLQRGARRHPLLAVSISYPPGDPGREDELIESIAEYCNAPVHWLDIQNIPLIERPYARAAARDEPFAHVYEMWNRALAEGSRAVGARIALDGVGGDHLFQVSQIYLADLFRSGRWPSLAREWRAKGMQGSRTFLRWVVYPLLPGLLQRAVAILRRGRVVAGYLERSLPPWFRSEFVKEHRLLERERENTPRHAGRSLSAQEMYWYLTYPYGARILSTAASLALDEGIETRSPLYDSRVITFAAGRPWHERSRGRETKRLLRASVAGLLPESVLAPRPVRSGITSGYLRRSLQEIYAPFLLEALREPVLAEFGIVDAQLLLQSCERYIRNGDEGLGVNLLFTLHVELWLRARLGTSGMELPAGF